MDIGTTRQQYVDPRSSRIHLSRVESAESSSSSPSNLPERPYQEYTYHSLSKYKGSIRVLVLLGNGSVSAEVECKLLHIDFIKDTPLEYTYEALSWCWGTSKPTGQIIIRDSRRDRKEKVRLAKKVTPDLVAALRALRYRRRDRFLWIDQICIDQGNPIEKNHQVEVMSEIYGRATKVCIWLGEGDDSSRLALEFIKREVLQLQNFDELCESEQASEKWSALLDLMQRPWFSRRWVVQEIALAHSTMVYCGSDKISWKKFAVAVELFVEVETATHRLSEVMKKDRRFYHVPGWFEYVSALGASLLVEATGKLFRDYKPNGPFEFEQDSECESDPEMEEQLVSDAPTPNDSAQDTATLSGSLDERNAAKHSPGQPLLTLEYLVSSLSIFEVTTPHDAVYALLAIARDTTPFADDKGGFYRRLVNTQEALEGYTQKKRYKVDYQQPFADTCKDFVAFCIESSKDRTRALDIICRPWAPDIPNGDLLYKGSRKRKVPLNDESSMWKAKRGRQANAKPRSSNVDRGIRPPNRDPSQSSGSNTPNGTSIQAQASRLSTSEHNQSIPLPSWTQSLSGAAYAMYSQAGVHTLKMGRKNADTLVGLPPSNQSLERNYNAAETRGVDLKSLRFAKRLQMKHWSMYVRGFVLDKAFKIQPSSQGGAIPLSWAKAGGWWDVPDHDPPDEFWRTLVADRGRDGKNPPVYYSRACKEAFKKGGLSSGSVNMTDLINNERCSVIAQFCRRVQAVIWNRCLITTDTGKLGLTGQDVQVGDLICILWGCSVPVVLRRVKKTESDVIAESEDDILMLKRRILAKYQKAKNNRQYRRKIENLDRALNHFWESGMRKAWAEDPTGLRAWREKRHTLRIITDERREKYKRVVADDGKEKPFIASSEQDMEELLEWQAYTDWKAAKRENREMSEKGFRRGDRRAFELQLRWGRPWLLRFKKRKAMTKSTAQPGPSNASEHHEHNGVNAHLRDPGGNAVRAPLPNKGKSKITNVRAVSDDYVLRHKERYLMSYGGYRTQNGTIELKEPDWSSTDKECLLIQDKWCYYKFLGECYVHGMMDGEAMAYQNEHEIRAQVFELR